eukprot:m.259537 g.259537  ORF g.259537 m.259537 type:complete len:375 (-) comp22584_c0_seq1:158-1282(-)
MTILLTLGESCLIDFERLLKYASFSDCATVTSEMFSHLRRELLPLDAVSGVFLTGADESPDTRIVVTLQVPDKAFAASLLQQYSDTAPDLIIVYLPSTELVEHFKIAFRPPDGKQRVCVPFAVTSNNRLLFPCHGPGIVGDVFSFRPGSSSSSVCVGTIEHCEFTFEATLPNPPVPLAHRDLCMARLRSDQPPDPADGLCWAPATLVCNRRRFFFPGDNFAYLQSHGRSVPMPPLCRQDMPLGGYYEIHDLLRLLHPRGMTLLGSLKWTGNYCNKPVEHAPPHPCDCVRVRFWNDVIVCIVPEAGLAVKGNCGGALYCTIDSTIYVRGMYIAGASRSPYSVMVFEPSFVICETLLDAYLHDDPENIQILLPEGR